jgi:hypothetical protein
VKPLEECACRHVLSCTTADTALQGSPLQRCAAQQLTPLAHTIVCAEPCSVKPLEEDERPKSGPHGVPRPTALSSVGSAPMPPPSPLGAPQPPIQPPGSAAAAGAGAAAVVPPSPRTQLTSRPSGEVPPSPAQQVGAKRGAKSQAVDAVGSCMLLHHGCVYSYRADVCCWC